MTEFEIATRIAAWTWAAETMGVEVTEERVANLVEVTRGIRLDNLRPALEAVIVSEPHGFLPSPGSVAAASRRIAERKSSSAPRLRAGSEMSSEANAAWHAERNVERWPAKKWAAFASRLGSDPAYANQVSANQDRRHEWALGQVDSEIGARPISPALRLKIRRDYNRAARLRFPHPDPLEGFIPPATDVVGSLVSGAAL